MKSRSILNIGNYFLLVIFLFIVSCSQKPEELLIGTWNGVGENQSVTWEFTKSTAVMKEKNVPFAFSYKIIGKDIIEMDSGFFAEMGAHKKIIIKFTVTKKELTMTNTTTNGKLQRYMRSDSSAPAVAQVPAPTPGIAPPVPGAAPAPAPGAKSQVDACVSAWVADYRKERGEEAMIKWDILEEVTKECESKVKIYGGKK